MKRFGFVFLSILLIAAMLAIPVFATTGGEPAASAAQIHGKVGQEVTVEVFVSGVDSALAMGIRYDLPEGLKLVEAQWMMGEGVPAVNTETKEGVWMNFNPVPLDSQAPVFVFTFVVLEPAQGQTDLELEIPVEIIVDDGQWMEATGKVTVSNPATAISLNKTDLQFDPCTAVPETLTASVLPLTTTDTVVWSSSDETVVTVDANGVVTVVGEGTAKIVATAGSKSASCNVTVSHDSVYTAAEGGHVRACNNGTYTSEVEPHDYRWVIDKKETELENGLKHALCRYCNAEGEKDVIIPHTHKVTRHDAVEPSCTEDGNVLYFTCESKLCEGKYYADRACTQELDKVVRPMVDHDYEWITVEATPLENGLKYQQCTVCKAKGEEVVLPHTHKVTEHKAVAATCKTEGNVRYYTCESKLCKGKLYSDKACTKTLTSVKVAVDGNTHVTEKVTGAKDPSCYKEGYSGDVVCADCGETLKKGAAIAATGKHTAGTKWESDATGHWHTCTTKGCTAKVDSAKHTAKTVVGGGNSGLEAGFTYEVCSVCGYVISKSEIPAPETTEPEVTEPEATEPVTTEPVTTEPVTTEPEVTEPETTEPETTEPEVTQPEPTVPTPTVPTPTAPAPTGPAPTEPEVTEPETTEPETTEPETTEPEATEPVTTEPATTTPATTTPETTVHPTTQAPATQPDGVSPVLVIVLVATGGAAAAALVVLVLKKRKNA